MIQSMPETDDTRGKFLAALYSVLDRKCERGFVLILTDEETWDFNHGNNLVEVRDALLSYARELAAYPGD